MSDLPATRFDKLSPAIIAAIVDSLRECNSFKNACELAGVSRKSGHRWMKEGAKHDGDALARHFRREVLEARAHAEAKLFGVVREAAIGGDWRAASRLLEMLNPRMNQKTTKVAGKIEHTFNWSKLMTEARDDGEPEQIEAGDQEWIAVAEAEESE